MMKDVVKDSDVSSLNDLEEASATGSFMKWHKNGS